MGSEHDIDAEGLSRADRHQLCPDPFLGALFTRELPL